MNFIAMSVGVWVFIAIVVILLIIFIVWWIVTSNNFIRTEVKVSESLSGIEVALAKRFDMLTKLRDTAASYASHEKTLFVQLTELRKGMSISELSQANTQANDLMARINAVAEAYPQLRSSDVFCELERGIMDAEEHLQAARRLYNSNVTKYNTMARVFPSSIVANAKRLTGQEFFDADDTQRADVSMRI
jgi:LemA protein